MRGVKLLADGHPGRHKDSLGVAGGSPHAVEVPLEDEGIALHCYPAPSLVEERDRGVELNGPAVRLDNLDPPCRARVNPSTAGITTLFTTEASADVCLPWAGAHRNTRWCTRGQDCDRQQQDNRSPNWRAACSAGHMCPSGSNATGRSGPRSRRRR